MLAHIYYIKIYAVYACIHILYYICHPSVYIYGIDSTSYPMMKHFYPDRVPDTLLPESHGQCQDAILLLYIIRIQINAALSYLMLHSIYGMTTIHNGPTNCNENK